jgi:Cu+-exporting ATPase
VLNGVMDRRQVLKLAAAVEALSEHPLARAILRAAGEEPLPRVSGFESMTGGGVRGVVEGREVSVTKPTSDDPEDRIAPLRAQGKTTVVLRVDRRPAALIALADRLKPGARRAMAALERLGLRTLLMTGDNEATARAIAAEAGIRHVLAGVLPKDKEAKVRELQAQGRQVAMVGDGINDAPALAASDVGIAMGTGADIAKEAGDLVLVSGELAQIPAAVSLSRAMMGRIRLGLFWAFAYNALLVPLAVLGYLHPMLAAAAMALSSVSVVANALTLRWWHPPATRADPPNPSRAPGQSQ